MKTEEKNVYFAKSIALRLTTSFNMCYNFFYVKNRRKNDENLNFTDISHV